MQLEDSIIFITGAARGLGRTMAFELAGLGARIGLIDIDAARLEETLHELPGRGHAAATADVTDERQVEQTFADLVGRLGGIDGLINNAGITRDGLLVKFRDGRLVDRMSLDHWRQVMDVNLTGVFLCAREAATHMVGAGRPGVIINIASISRVGNFGQTNYSAAKAGVAAMATTWSKELARHGIRSVSVSPGFARTELVAAMPEKAVGRITGQIPLARLGEPEEIASTVRFILENDYINGRDFAVDGGLRL